MAIGYLYITRNLDDGWVYAGQSSRLDERNVSQYLGSGDLMLQAIQAHGVSAFKKEILGYYDNQNDLDYAEILEIARLRAVGFELYNSGVGGPRTESRFIGAMRSEFGVSPVVFSAWYRAVNSHPEKVKGLLLSVGPPSTEEFYWELERQLQVTQDLGKVCGKCAAGITQVCRTKTGKPTRNHAGR